MTRPGSKQAVRVSKHRVLLFPNSSKSVSHVLKTAGKTFGWCQLRLFFFLFCFFPPSLLRTTLKSDALVGFPPVAVKTRLNRGVKKLFLPFKQHSQNEEGEGERHGAVEVSQTGVFHARWRTLQVCPRNILWKPKSLTPKPVWDRGSHRGTRRG